MEKLETATTAKLPSRSPSEKADATTRVAREIIRQETAARDAKTARLKALRLAMEAEKAIDAAEAAPPKPKTAPKPKAAPKPKTARARKASSKT